MLFTVIFVQRSTETSIYSCDNCLGALCTINVNMLTQWGRVTHICISKLTIIGSDNGLSPGRHQAIIWTNAGRLLIGPSGTNFSEILIEIYTCDIHIRAISQDMHQPSITKIYWRITYLRFHSNFPGPNEWILAVLFSVLTMLWR